MSTENVVEFSIEEGNLIVNVDPNKDGQNVIELKVNLLEVPDEILSALQKAKADA